MKHFKKRDYGFTLLETLIVVAIMGVMAAIATPSIISMLRNIRVNGAARNLFSDLMLAKFRAISENNKYIITFDINNNRYSIYDDNNNNGTADSSELYKTVNIGTDSPDVRFGYVSGTIGVSGSAITSSVNFSGNPPKFYFKTDGTASDNGTAYFILSQDLTASSKDRMKAVTVITTGRIKSYRYKSSINPPWE
ncbi:MAG: hypothetical protein A3C43_07195 [Candidatus Schekmanbacteria bacterium RIFCSPHIGHO2_02_FULL_38_11]|uniref:General secretion pathway GspH domain-containing protein n=1 Tax=Candidatus Schekmanbacteria bacterium RIFCSPLOWO2_12_FULL_38_15 TaxID=1817883 RepID=A0A1F7SK98_9BACT|nr:MAG: hypothetical protein A2043_08685 [Candidatus Schekmanbacteria bacterium GWA2_38_9]OGL51255.1 MAG: hypothetical protein A3H37_10605 [Candidatus Schekmanbacteria bacterium RIFCSPLOWO2_02_FULL_38_14]OGL53669.1 MAG: hypothetical protein A3C43_07195 [Candidatus Schekmanbacteria bacterium RIFCSPHIGHO2_02_FULL_38_11]OGL54206.1 MAG: hypothetical protein A3G31_05445 [Candidatus Schekmanbacteria bacterium RIFCSPLOWO2_12_FULL_38_15]